MLLLILAAAVGGLVYYESVYKPAHTPPPAPATPSPAAPAYIQYGLTFLNPTVAQVVLAALGAVRGSSTTQTDSAGQPYFVTTPSATFSLNDTPVGTSLGQAIAAGAAVLLVGDAASWAQAGGAGAVPNAVQAMVTHLPSAGDSVLAQLQRLAKLAGGGVVLGPQAAALAGT